MNLEKSTIFITGGAGFVGSYTIEKLLPLNPRRIIILDNLLRGTHRNMESFAKDPRVTFVEGDIRNEALVKKLMAESDYLIHLAALRITRCAENPAEAFEVMLRGTFNVVEAAKDCRIKRVLYASSASVYGLAETFPTPESNHPYDNQTFYGGAKIWGEQLLRSYRHMYELPYVAVRYFNIYGPRMDTEGKYTEVLIRWLDCMRSKTPPRIFGDGGTSMDMIYIEDVARANVAAFTSNVNDEVFNIGYQHEVTLKQLLTTIMEVNGSTLQPEFHPEAKANPVRRRLADVSKAKKLLGFEAEVPLEEGIRRLSKWYFESK